MFVVKPYESRITYIHRDGTKKVFKNLNEAIRELGHAWLANNVGEHFWMFDRNDWLTGSPLYRHYNVILRDDEGKPVLVGIPRRRRGKWVNRYSFWNGEGPVPWTRCQRGGGSYFRSIRHVGAYRIACGVLKEEGEPPIRGKRTKSAVPNSWDDYPISANRNRNWKRHRKTQWRN